jgi:hypothetical protein
MFGTVLVGAIPAVLPPLCCGFDRLATDRLIAVGIERAPTFRRRACRTPTRKVARMARPWRKKSAWPYVAKSGRRSYTLGFYDVASVPAVRFNEPQAPRAWREEMMGDGTPKPTREHAWRVLCAALSWAAGSQMVPEVQTNGCILANEGVLNRRRSARRGGTGYAPATR